MKKKKITPRQKTNKHNSNKIKNISKRILIYLGIIICVLFISSIVSVVVYKYCPVSWTPLMSIRRTEARKEGRRLEIKHEWRDISDISPYMIEAAIVGEDDLFYKHNGFSRKGIENAIEEYKSNKKVTRGGSTISQQTAKNVFCTNHHNIFRKGIEAYFTVLIEWIWGKERIIEVYVNSIEMGDGIFGAEAASQTYFRHSAKNLTLSEACLIGACIPSPRKWSVTRPGPYVKKRQQTLIQRCKKKAYAQPDK